MDTEQGRAAAGTKFEEMQIGSLGSRDNHRLLQWVDRLSVTRQVCLMMSCLLLVVGLLLVSGLRTELLWEAQGGPAIGAPAQSLVPNAARRMWPTRSPAAAPLATVWRASHSARSP